MMRKTKRLILICIISLLSINVNAQNENEYDWSQVMNAIIQVESKGNPKAVDASGTCVGILQIKSILVKEVNNILRMEKEKKRYTDSDRYNVEKSKEMFIILQEHFNKNHNVEKAIRYWNAGFYYEKAYGTAALNRKTKNYYKKVMNHYKNNQGGN